MRWIAIVFVLIVLTGASHASAGDDFEGRYLLVGPMVGTHVTERGAGLLLGAELTLVRVEEDLRWVGLISDARLAARPGSSAGLFFVGIEGGVAMLGFDAGPVLVVWRDRPQLGMQASLSFNLGLGHFQARVGQGSSYGWFVELAVTVKSGWNWPLRRRAD